MTQYAYKARAIDGTSVGGRREAENVQELSRRLRAEGFHLVEAREKRTGPKRLARCPKASIQDLLLFTFNLRTMLEAGLPLLTALADLEEETKSPSVRRVIRQIGETIAGGSTLAHALERNPGVFPSSYRAMVAAGESSGRLVEALDRLHSLLEWRQELRSQLRQLTTYPIVVLIALFGLGILALVWVIPRFESILIMAGGSLPLPTRILVAASTGLREDWPWAILFCIGVIVGTFLLRRVRSFRLVSDRVSLRLPIVGPLIAVSSYSQVVHFLGAGIDSGLGLPESLELTAAVVENRALKQAIDKVRHQVIGGASLGESFKSAGVFPPFVQRMVTIGENSGSLVETLRRAQIVYDRELPAALKRFAAAFQPAVTLVMGGALLFMILAILLPLYRIYDSLGGAT